MAGSNEPRTADVIDRNTGFAVAALLGIVAFFDWAMPLGIAGGVPYVLPVWLASSRGGNRLLYGTVVIAVALVMVGWVVSPGLGIASWIVATNRALAVLAILVAAGVGWWLPEREQRPRSSVPVGFAAPLLTALAIIAALWMFAREARLAEVQHLREREVVRLRGEVLSLDETLTMSVHMAAQTGDPVWVRRYLEHEAQLDEVFDELEALGETSELVASRSAEAANERLVALERESLDRIEAGELASARVIVSSAKYAREKKRYREATEALLQALQETQRRQRDAQWRRAAIQSVGIGLAGLLCIAAWVATIRAMTAWQHSERSTREELAASNEALERSNADLQKFAYVAAHDLQTPLRAISGYVEFLRDEYRGRLSADADHYIDRILNGTQRLKGLIDDLLAYSRVQTHRQPFTSVALGRVMDDVSAMVGPAFEQAGGELSWDPLPTVHGDAAQLSQLLLNLVDNGLKYRCDRPPRVTVSARRDDPGWALTVRDNGIGIDKEHHERVFEMFRRLHTADAYPGTGIGLSVCRRIVLRHGGRIWIESEPGEGTAVSFTLRDAEPEREAAPQAGDEPVRSHG